MSYPPAFRAAAGLVESLLVAAGRLASTAMHRLIPGKRRASALLVANRRTRDALPAVDGVAIVDLVENGVDRALFARRPKTSDPSPIPRFVYMGRLVDWKRVDLLLRAFAAARSIHPMVLEIIGDGPERDRLATLAAALNLTGDDTAVVFTGWMDQQVCARRLDDARALVLPSIYECGGAVVLEAMAMGRAVIATAWGGPLDYLTEESGILVEPTSEDGLVDGLRDAMTELAGDAVRAERMGRSGAAEVAQRHDWDAKVDTMLGIYRRALVEPGPAARSAKRSGM